MCKVLAYIGSSSEYSKGKEQFANPNNAAAGLRVHFKASGRRLKGGENGLSTA